jgi:hypothetical protein
VLHTCEEKVHPGLYYWEDRDYQVLSSCEERFIHIQRFIPVNYLSILLLFHSSVMNLSYFSPQPLPTNTDITFSFQTFIVPECEDKVDSGIGSSYADVNFIPPSQGL